MRRQHLRATRSTVKLAHRSRKKRAIASTQHLLARRDDGQRVASTGNVWHQTPSATRTDPPPDELSLALSHQRQHHFGLSPTFASERQLARGARASSRARATPAADGRNGLDVVASALGRLACSARRCAGCAAARDQPEHGTLAMVSKHTRTPRDNRRPLRAGLAVPRMTSSPTPQLVLSERGRSGSNDRSRPPPSRNRWARTTRRRRPRTAPRRAQS